MHLSIVIPCHNEANRITATIKRLEDFFRGNTEERQRTVTENTKCIEQVEIICVENGSTDTTIQVLNQLMKNSSLDMKVVHSPKGKGAAVQEGIKQAKHEYTLITDADNATDIKYILDMVQMLQGASDAQVDIINSSRRIKGAHVVHKQGVLRQILGNLFHILVHAIFDLSVTDSQNGFKLFKTKVAQEIYKKVTTTGWVSEIELFIIAKVSGYTVREIPVGWHDVSGSTLGLKDAPQIAKDLVKLYWRYRIRIDNDK